MALIQKNIRLEMTPGVVPPIVHVSQNDINRQFSFELMDEGQIYVIPSGCTAKVEGTAAGIPFSIDATISDNKVKFSLAACMTVYLGPCWTKIKLTKNGAPVSTCGFVLLVDPAGIDLDAIARDELYRAAVEEIAQDIVESIGVPGSVASVNGKTGTVVLDAADVDALPETAPVVGKNLVASYKAAVISASTWRNVICNGEKAIILYRNNDANNEPGKDFTTPYFQINLSSPLKAGVLYTFSCSCSGVGSLQLPKFVLMDDAAIAAATAISQPFDLEDGRLIVSFTPDHNISSFVRFHENPGATHTVFDTRIEISEIQIEQGGRATLFHPSVLSVFEEAKAARAMTHTYIEQASSEGWATAEFEGVHLIASTPIIAEQLHFLSDAETKNQFTLEGANHNGYAVSEKIYAPLPYPNRYTSVYGCCDRGMAVVVHANSIGGRAPVGVSFRLLSPYYPRNFDVSKVTIRLFTSDRRHVVPSAPEYAYNSTIASQIVAVARSYISAQEAGRKFVYGANILYGEYDYRPRKSDGRINDENGKAIMECDTFVGMVLRGISYENSPYNPAINTPHASCGWQFTPAADPGGWEQAADETWSYSAPQYGSWSQDATEAAYAADSSNGVNREKNKRIIGTNGRTGYEQLMYDTSSNLPTWAQKLREKMTSDVARACYGRDIKYACDYAWMFWAISTTLESEAVDSVTGEPVSTKTIGCVFSNPAKAKPGDVVFIRKPDEKRWFDNISHVALVTSVDAYGNITIAEVTGSPESGGRVVHEKLLGDKLGEIACFARPYGWY